MLIAKLILSKKDKRQRKRYRRVIKAKPNKQQGQREKTR